VPYSFLKPPRGFCGERKKRVGDNHSPIFTGPFFYLLPGPRGVGFQITRLPDFSMTQSESPDYPASQLLNLSF